MTSTFAIRFDAHHCAQGVIASSWDELPTAVRALGLGPPRPVVAVVGGADVTDLDLTAELASVLAASVVPAMITTGAVGVDGGTDSGVMRALGSALAGCGRPYALVGVAAEGTVRLPMGQESARGPSAGASLDPHHSHFVLVPGDSWGDESRWLARTASALADRCPSLTLVANGGDITYHDVGHSLAEGRRVIALRGTGRAADDLAAAAAGRPASARARALAESGLIVAHELADRPGLAALVTAWLTSGSAGHRPTRRT